MRLCFNDVRLFVLQKGPFVKLQMGQETSHYIDNESPSHCFCNCGHMASEKTVKLVSIRYISISHCIQVVYCVCRHLLVLEKKSQGSVHLLH